MVFALTLDNAKATKGCKSLSWTWPSTCSGFSTSFRCPRGIESVSVLSSCTVGRWVLTLWPPCSRASPLQGEARPGNPGGSVRCFQIWFGLRFCQLPPDMALWGKLLTFLYLSFFVCAMKGTPSLIGCSEDSSESSTLSIQKMLDPEQVFVSIRSYCS